MKASLIGAAASLFLLGGMGATLAQDIIITPEQETVVREYVQKKPAASIKLPGVELNIGSTVPDTVELYEVPDVKYRYVVIDDRTVLVDPGTHKIVKVLN